MSAAQSVLDQSALRPDSAYAPAVAKDFDVDQDIHETQEALINARIALITVNSPCLEQAAQSLERRACLLRDGALEKHARELQSAARSGDINNANAVFRKAVLAFVAVRAALQQSRQPTVVQLVQDNGS